MKKLLFLAGALWSMPVNAAVVCDGVTDDTAAIQAAIDAANGDWVNLPAGTCRITADLTRIAGGNVGYQDGWGYYHRPGIKIRGAGSLSTIILADYNGDATKGGIIRTDTSTVRNYLDGNAIEDLRITQASGRTGLNGIQVTAAWDMFIRRVQIDHLSGSGIKASWRSDLDIGLSDAYQSFAVIVEHSTITQNGGWGVDFGAGQSPGLYALHQNMILRNAGGGIRSTTGQCEIVGNAITENGSYGGNGGLLFDTQEGPQFVAEVKQNEFDNNFSWHINLKRSRNAHIHLNRFLSGSYVDNTSFTRNPGSSFLRPYVHVNLGVGPTNEVWNALIEKNYHRSVGGEAPTTASVIGYAASGGSLSSSFPVRIRYNDFGPMPADGVTQNSTGLTKFSGFTGTGAEIIDP